MSTPNYENEPLLHYIPDPSKREIKAGKIHGLEIAVQRALQKPLQPLMTVVPVDDANAYLSQKQGKDVVLNGQGEALHVYEHESRTYYRRSDLDAIVFENLEHQKEAKDKIRDKDSFDWLMDLPVDDAPEGSLLLKPYAEGTEIHTEPTPAEILPVHETIYTSFEERYRTKITISREEGLQRVIRAWNVLSLLEQTTLTWAYVEKKGVKELQEGLALTNDEYKEARKSAEDIMLGALGDNKIPVRDYNATSSTRQAPAKRPEGCELLLRHYGIALNDEEQQEMDAVVNTLDPKEKYAVLAYYRDHVQIVHVAREMKLPLTEVRPLIESGFAKIRSAFDTSVFKETKEREEAPSSGTETDDERTKKFLPPARDETAMTPAMLLYHALMIYNTGKKTPDGPARVEEAMRYLTEMQREILHMYYVRRGTARRIEERFGIKHTQYIRERDTAVRIVREVLEGKYKSEEHVKPATPTQRPKRESKYGEERKVQRAFTLEQIAAAKPHLTPIQRKIVDLLYKEQKSPAEAIEAAGVSTPYYYMQKKSAETTIRAIANGTYTPPKGRGRIPAANTPKREQSNYEEREHRVKKKPGATTTGIPKNKQDLYRRLEEYRALHGTKSGDIRTKEDERDLEKYIGNLGKGSTESAEDEESATAEVSLEERCQEKHKQVQTFLREMRRLPDLSVQQNVYDLSAVIIGDSTIDFLINSAAYPVAALYAERLYVRAKTHGEESSKKRGTQAPYVWPLVTKETYNPRMSENKRAANHSNHFIQSYEAYAAGEKTPETLVALYKENLALLRGYVAVVGWHIGSNRTFRPDWEYRPRWKIAWQELTDFLKEKKKAGRKKETEEHKGEDEEERRVPLHLRATSFRELVKDRAIKAALHRGYATMHHYSERARNVVVEQFTRLAIKRANKFLYLGMPFDDTVQEGKNGLFRATSRFDYTRLTKEGKPHTFMTYAQWWVDQMIRRAAQDEREVPVWIQEYVSKMNRIEAELMQDLGTRPSEAVLHEEFLARTGVNESTLKKILKARLKMNPISLEVSTTDDPEGRTLLDTLKDGSVVAADETAIDKQLTETVEDLLKTLPKREREVLRERFWGNKGEGKTLEEIGAEEDLTRERIRQIEMKALRNLRQKLRTEPELREELGMDIIKPNKYSSAKKNLEFTSEDDDYEDEERKTGRDKTTTRTHYKTS